MFRGEYSVQENGTVMVCVHGRTMGYEAAFDLCNVIISFTLNLISIFSMTATLITYILFKELRNLPGLNLMCLTVSIFVSRVRRICLYLDGPQETFCKTFIELSRGSNIQANQRHHSLNLYTNKYYLCWCCQIVFIAGERDTLTQVKFPFSVFKSNMNRYKMKMKMMLILVNVR